MNCFDLVLNLRNEKFQIYACIVFKTQCNPIMFGYLLGMFYELRFISLQVLTTK